MSDPIDVLVAGMPYGMPHPNPDGRWLSPAHVSRIEGVSPRIRLEEMTRAEFEAGAMPRHMPDVLLTETTGSFTHWDETDWLQYMVRGRDLARVLTPDLRWVHSCSHGVEHVLPILDASVALTHGHNIHSIGLAESVIAAILYHAKRLPDRVERQRRHAWELLEYAELHGQTICIVGTGGIGSAVARLASAFGMRVIGVRRTPRPAADFDRVIGPEGLVEVLAESPYVVLACPLTSETQGMIGANELATMPSGAFLANVGRGGLLDEAALLSALQSGHLGGAFLDVFTKEPLPPDDPLWDAPNTLIIPHDSHTTMEVGTRNVELFVRNLERFVAGEPLSGVVDRSTAS